MTSFNQKSSTTSKFQNNKKTNYRSSFKVLKVWRKKRLVSKRINSLFLKKFLQAARQEHQYYAERYLATPSEFWMGYAHFIQSYKYFYKYFYFNNISIYKLTVKANQKFGLYKKGLGLTKYFNRRFFNYRYQIDNKIKDVIIKGHKTVAQRNLFWIRNKTQQKRLEQIWKTYRFMLSWRPYTYIRKKYKLYFNWGDLVIFKRYPLYRRKYKTLFYYPRFQDYRRLFKNQLYKQHLFRWLFRLKYKQLVKKFKKSALKSKRVFELVFLNFFEMRMDVIIYRLNFAFSIKQARQWVNRSFFQVNNKTINWYSFHLSIGDILTPSKNLRLGHRQSKQWVLDKGYHFFNDRLFYRQIQADQYPSHLLLNERIPAGMVCHLPNPHQVRYHRPFSVQFLTLSLNKYS
jgi:ribosomal protein S4